MIYHILPKNPVGGRPLTGCLAQSHSATNVNGGESSFVTGLTRNKKNRSVWRWRACCRGGMMQLQRPPMSVPPMHQLDARSPHDDEKPRLAAAFTSMFSRYPCPHTSRWKGIGSGPVPGRVSSMQVICLWLGCKAADVWSMQL